MPTPFSSGPTDEHSHSPSASRTQVQSLSRGLAVIRSFTADRPRQTISQVAGTTRLAKSTARRFLLTLVDVGYAETDGSDFWLTPKILELGFSYLSGLELPAIAQPRLEELSRTVNEASSMSVLDGTDIAYLCRIPVRRIMTVAVTVGSRFPAWATSMGRVLLSELTNEELDGYLRDAHPQQSRSTERTAFNEGELREELKRIAAQGWSLVDQDLAPGLRCLAAPVRSPDGQALAAINVSTVTPTSDLAALTDRILPHLLRTARLISDDLTAQRAHTSTAPR